MQAVLQGNSFFLQWPEEVKVSFKKKKKKTLYLQFTAVENNLIYGKLHGNSGIKTQKTNLPSIYIWKMKLFSGTSVLPASLESCLGLFVCLFVLLF